MSAAPAFDANAIRHDYRLAAVAESFGVRLTRDGREWKALCPFAGHVEADASFTIFTGKDRIDRFHCFGCGRGGDVIEFVQEMTGKGFVEACEEITGNEAKTRKDSPENRRVDLASGMPNARTERGNNVREQEVALTDLTPLPVPPHAPPFTPGTRILNPKRLTSLASGLSQALAPYYPSHVHAYHTAGGGLAGYVLRMELRGGGKVTPQVIWARSETLNYDGWTLGALPSPKPLYRLAELTGKKGQLLILAGEKKSDQAARVLTKMIPISWAGGDNAWHLTDWTPLQGRSVVLWPDNDAPGRGAMWGSVRRTGWREGLAEHLLGLGCQVKGVGL